MSAPEAVGLMVLGLLLLFGWTAFVLQLGEDRLANIERHRLDRELMRIKAEDARRAATVTGEAQVMLLARCDLTDELREFVLRPDFYRKQER